MFVAILTFDVFNELDSRIALGILGKVRKPGWRVSIASPTPRVTFEGISAAEGALRYVVQGGEKEEYVARAMGHIMKYLAIAPVTAGDQLSARGSRI